MTISAVVLTKNEEVNIKRCLASVRFCDEIIIIDDYSSDNTVNIARKFGASVYKHNLNDDFAGQRNFSLTKVHSNWILFLDADEVISEELAKEIRDAIKDKNNNETDGYYIRRVDNIFGRRVNYAEFGNIKLLRLARKDRGEWKRKVHEYWDINGKTRLLNGTINHYPHQSLGEFIESINKFSTIHAECSYTEGKRSSLAKIVFMPVLKFINNFLLNFGFLDGIVGLVLSLLMSLHSFLSWSKLWMMQKNTH